MAIIGPFAVLSIILAAVSILGHRDAHGRALALRRSGFGFMIVYGALGTLFIAGETFSDPGGLKALGFVALWAIPMVAFSLLGWSLPGVARVTFIVVTALIVASSIWFAADRQAWLSFENSHGPVRAIAIFATSVAIAVFGYHHPRLGGVLLLIDGIVPVTLASLTGAERGMSSLGVLVAPAIITGALYLWSTFFDDTIDRRKQGESICV